MNNIKKKVIFGFNGLSMGGMEKQFIEQMRFFDTEKFDIRLISLMNLDNSVQMYNLLPKDMVVYRLNFRGWFDIFEWFKLYKLLRNIKPNIVVSSLFFSNMVFRVLKVFIGYKAIAREHNTYVNKTKIQQLIDRLLSYVSFKIVAVSNTVADFTSKQEKIPLNKFMVINNGIDVIGSENKLKKLPTKNILKEQLGFCLEDKIILNVARLTKQKNHKLLIDGFSLFVKNNPDYKLLIVGGGSEEVQLRKYIKELDLSNKIILTGMKYDIWPYYKMADVFSSTSLIEGFSNAYLEALTAGLPLVVTKTGGVGDILIEGVNGVIINEFLPQVVCESLERVIYKKINNQNDIIRKTVLNFDIKTIVKKYEDLLQSGLTLECIGMQDSGKTFVIKYLEKEYSIKTVFVNSLWKEHWIKYGIEFILKNPFLFCWVLFISFKESLLVFRPMLFFHKIYIFLIVGSQKIFLYKKYPNQLRGVDEGFMQFICSLYEHKLKESDLERIVKIFPISDIVLYMKEKIIIEGTIGKISQKRASQGQYYVQKWKNIFRFNLNALVQVLKNKERGITEAKLEEGKFKFDDMFIQILKNN
ncbi:MAG: glycosyltransferase [Patescibacteria group bacterium]